MAQHTVIIGNGISGITCARELRKRNSDARITVISAETEHFFSRTALMYVYMGHMQYHHIKPYEDWFWKKNRIDLVHDRVKTVDTTGRLLALDKGAPLPYDTLVLACGSQSNMPDWPGKALKGVQGLYSYQDLEQMQQHTTGIFKAVITGGGLLGVEMAEMLRSRGIDVTLLVKDKYYWNSILPDEEAQMIGRHLAEHGVHLVTECEVESIQDDNNNGRAHQVKTKDGRAFPCEFFGVTVGVHANISFLENSGIEADKGILVNKFFETNLPGVYAIGDCVQYRNPPEGRKPVEQVWYTGRMHGEVLGKTLGGEKTAYRPGPWFNSAKFFDIEYQTYGLVPPKPTDDQQTFYWEHPKGRIAFRATFAKDGHALQGINAFGLRLRHDVVDRWLRDKKDMTYVMTHLEDANFDPELYRHLAPQIITAYNQQYNTSLTGKPKSWKRLLGLAS